MDKINFKNLPNKTTPINAENLNKIQENAEKAINEKSSLPVGGDEGQILAKASNQDNDVEWIDNIGQGGGDTLPIGAILPFSGDVIPNGWLLCDGSVIEQEDYPELFEVLAGNYGIISREEIRLPDLRGKVTVGKDSTDTDFNTLGNTGGEKTHNLTIDEMPSHNHELKRGDYGSVRREEISYSNGENIQFTSAGVSNTGGDQPHNNLQPYIVTNYIIKAKMTVAIEGEIIQEDGIASEINVYSASAVDNKLAQIIQSGSNANGSYIKYSDGTMICYGNYSFNSSNSDYWGNFYRSENYTINFPQEFSTTPIVNVTPNSDDGGISAVLNTVSLNTFKMCQLKSKGINQNTDLSNSGQYVAIGRWK